MWRDYGSERTLREDLLERIRHHYKKGIAEIRGRMEELERTLPPNKVSGPPS